MNKFLTLMRNQDGAVAYFVIVVLAFLLSTSAIASAVGTIESAKANGNSAAQILVLAVAKHCQQQPTGCASETIESDLKANPSFSKLVQANGFKLSEIQIINLSVESATQHRSQVTLSIRHNAYVPLAQLLGRASDQQVLATAKASWTDYEYVRKFNKGSYLPLVINDCVFPDLVTPDGRFYTYRDNENCLSSDEPKLWWFGNAGNQFSKDGSGNAIQACFRNSAGPELSIGDKVNNASAGTMPAQEDCETGKTYLVPYFKNYTKGGPLTKTVTSTSYEKVWEVVTKATETWKEKGNNYSAIVASVTQSFSKTCANSSDTFDSNSCTTDSGFPTPAAGATCPNPSLNFGASCSTATASTTLKSSITRTSSKIVNQFSNVWTQLSEGIKTVKVGKNTTSTVVSTITQTHTLICENANDDFGAATCVASAGSPYPSSPATCSGVQLAAGESCAVTTYPPVFVSSSQEKTDPYGTIAGFMRVRLVSIYFDNPLENNQAKPEHRYELAYAGRDIRLLPN